MLKVVTKIYAIRQENRSKKAAEIEEEPAIGLRFYSGLYNREPRQFWAFGSFPIFSICYVGNFKL